MNQISRLVLIILLAYISISNGLRCYECNPCEGDEKGELKDCTTGFDKSCKIHKNTQITTRSCSADTDVGCKTTAGGDSKTCICQSDECNETFEKAEPETTTKTPETTTTIPETVNNTDPSNPNETILQCYQCGKQTNARDKRFIDEIPLPDTDKILPCTDCDCENDEQGELINCTMVENPVCAYAEEKISGSHWRSCVSKDNDIVKNYLKAMGGTECNDFLLGKVCLCEKDGCNRNSAMCLFDSIFLQIALLTFSYWYHLVCQFV